MSSSLCLIASRQNALRTVERLPLEDLVNLLWCKLRSSNGAEPFTVQTVRDALKGLS
jgi:hypothetical protein